MKQFIFSVLICLAIFSSCKKNEDVQTTPEEKVVASFDISNLVSKDNILEGNVCAFNNTSKGAVSYSWDFGNSTSSNEAVPADQSFVPCGGHYTITLTAKSASGKTATCSHDYTILCRGKMAHKQGKGIPTSHFSTAQIQTFLAELHED